MYIKVTYLLFGVSCLLEPLIWIYAFELEFKRKCKAAWPLIGYICIDYITALVKQFAGLKISDLVFTVFMITYVLFFLTVFYKGRLLDKIACTATMFLTSLAADAIALGVFVLIGHSMKDLSSFGITNMLATIISKLILFGIVNTVFRKKTKVDQELVPIMFSTILMELPTIELFNKMSLLKDVDSFFLIYVIGQMGLLLVIGYVMYIIKKQKKKENQLRKRTRDMQMQLEGTEVAAEVFENLRMLRHDMKYHMGTVKALIKEKKYNEAECYLDKVYKDIDIAEQYFTLKNRNVSITLDRMKQKAKDEGVGFFTKIMTDEFIIDDMDICTILINICLNAIEAAKETSEKYVKLVISNKENGYLIECENSYNGSLSMKKGEYISTKGSERGLGIKIVKKIVEKNKGKYSFIGKDEIFKVNVFIHGE